MRNAECTWHMWECTRYYILPVPGSGERGEKIFYIKFEVRSADTNAGSVCAKNYLVQDTTRVLRWWFARTWYFVLYQVPGTDKFLRMLQWPHELPVAGTSYYRTK